MPHHFPGRRRRGGPGLGWALWAPLALLCSLGAAGAQNDTLSPGAVEKRLDNGLRLVFQYDPASPIVAVCAFVHTSAAQETWNGAGVRELLQLMGQQMRIPPGETEETPPPAVEMRATLSRDYVEMVALCLPEDFAGGLRRLKWALFDPYFADEPFRFAQDRLAQEVMARQADAGSVAQDALVARLYPQWPGSWPLVGMGAAAWVNRTYAQSFQHDHYLSNLTLLSVCGPVEWPAVQQQTDQILGGLLPGGKPELLPPPVGAPPETEPWEGTVPGTPVCAVGVGARGPTLVADDYPATSVLMALLGSGRGSRLYRRLREEQNASYTIEAGLTPSQVCPYVYMLASCTADQRAAVQAAMLAELADVRERLPSEAEVARARLVLWGQYQLHQQSAGDLAHYQGIFALLGGDEGLTDWQTLALRLSAVRPEQVQAMAQKYLAAPVVVTVRGGEGAPTTN